MAPSSFTLLLLRCLSHHNHRYLRHHRHQNNHRIPYSTTTTTTEESPKPSLSSRLSFVFEKIDEIEKDRTQKDEALQRIRAWRESKNLNQTSTGNNREENDELGLGSSAGDDKVVEGVKEDKVGLGLMKREIELAHPWPEWIGLMERLVQQNYFDFRRKDEDSIVEGLGGFDGSTIGEEDGFDFTRDWKTVQTAILNFGRDRFDIFRSLSRQDIQLLVGYGCPSVDKKVVFSSKLLRKHAHLDEGDVCSTCCLRNTCERAYLVTNKEDEARTMDVMRVLLTYGFDPINGSVENKSLLKKKSVKTVVKKLLHEVVRLSAVPIDPNLPPPVIKQRPPKVKQPPPPPKRRVGRDDIEMKKGDWLCPKCNFMNFAKNVVCLQCDAKRPKRELLPGEWECPQCNFLNYRRNMTCFNCEHKRPPDEYLENQTSSRQQRPVTKLERVVNRTELSDAWNFDFDDDESDGADVAAFEYADSRAMNEDRLLDSQPENANFGRGSNEDLPRFNRSSRSQENEQFRPTQMETHSGFDDFDDEGDDIDNYELDNNENRSKNQEAPSIPFSDVEAYSECESDDDLPIHGRKYGGSNVKSTRSLHRKGTSGLQEDDLDFDSDEDLPVHPKWRSSHVADSGRRGRGARGSSGRKNFSSDEDDRLAFGSDNDLEGGFSSKRGRGSGRSSVGQRGFKRNDASNHDRKPNGFSSGRQDVNFVRGNDFDDERGMSSRGYRGNQRGSSDNKREGHRTRGRPSGGRGSGGGGGGHRKFNESDKWSDVDNERPARQRINVR